MWRFKYCSLLLSNMLCLYDAIVGNLSNLTVVNVLENESIIRQVFFFKHTDL